MADKDEKKPAEGEDGKAAPKSKKKLLIIGGIGLIVIIGVAVAMFFVFNKKPKPAAGDNAAVAAPAEGEKPAEGGGGHGGGAPAGEKGKAGANRFLALEPFILNLADVEVNRYLKVNITVEFSDSKTLIEAEGKIPVIRDAMIMMMSSMTYSDIHSVEGKMTLQSEIQNRLNKALETGQVKRIYFTDLVVQ